VSGADDVAPAGGDVGADDTLAPAVPAIADDSMPGAGAPDDGAGAADDGAADDGAADDGAADDGAADDGAADDGARDDGARDDGARDDGATDDDATDDGVADEGASGAGGSAGLPLGSGGAGGMPSVEPEQEPEPPLDTVCDASAAPSLGPLGLEVVVSTSELSGVSYARQPPDSEDWYLVEQGGRIMVFADGALRTTPFFDVTDEMNVDSFYDERGLHAIEFAPDYATSGLFYIVMTASAGDRANRDMVFEYRRSDADPYVAELTPTRELLNLAGTEPNSLLANVHNAYLAKFGPDGYLYVGMGDGGGGCNDQPGFEGLPQDLNSPIGKILRFDPKAEPPYAAPGNPFADVGDARVFHYGVRNPFRFSWDAANGDFYFGEVGQDTHEEINVAPAGSAGLNFGWATWEGDEMVCSNRTLASGSEAIAPIFFTDHGTGNNSFGAGCSASPFCDYGAIVGGAVYRGAAIDSLRGAYVFGDWVSDNMAAITHCDGVTSDVTSIDYVADPNLPNNGYFVKVGDGVPDLSAITAIVEDHDLELHLVANGDSLLKIVPAP
jgi:glucose/arabinose dehydrogenase